MTTIILLGGGGGYYAHGRYGAPGVGDALFAEQRLGARRADLGTFSAYLSF
jgi:hypothetical protein